MADDDDFAKYEDERLADVIPLPRALGYAQNEVEAKLDELPVRLSEKPRACDHRGSVVDASARTLTCRSCGVALDPIDVLSKLARSRESLVSQGVFLRRQVDSLRETVATLERAERNAKARIRNARRRRGDEWAVEVACMAIYDGQHYQRWEALPESLRESRRREFRPGLEAYAAALDEPAREEEAG